MARPKKRSILLIDQDAHLLSIYEKRFEAAGWKVASARSFPEGKKRLARLVPDAIVMDLHPLAGGLIFLEDAYKDPRMASVVRVVLTDVGDRRTVKEVEGLGIKAYVLKGHVSPSELINKIKSSLV
ncbi:response regulator [Candidatus Uhrbacteria bacterium]|nr:response regulator [Candidatus Uhrbacteria bacterium]